MKNASRMARYMMMRTGREGGGYESNRYPSGPEIRNGYGGRGNEGGNYARDDYGVDNRFRDRRGREHYDNGRFAPRNGMDERMGGDDGGSDYRGGGDYRSGSRPHYGPYKMNDEEEERGRVIGFGERYAGREWHEPKAMEDPAHNSAGKMTERREMRLTPEKAKRWVENMQNEEGVTGEHWTVDQVKALMSQKSIDYDPYEVYAIMNSLYSDYGKVFKRRGITAPEMYLELAMAWLRDKDAVKNKAEAYYEYVVKH